MLDNSSHSTKHGFRLPKTPRLGLGMSSNTHSTQLTPRTLTDGGFKGELKRSEVLETQIREISQTASQAYDKIDDLKTRNNMLEEQVAQQKRLIHNIMGELDTAKDDAEKVESLVSEAREQAKLARQAQAQAEMIAEETQERLKSMLRDSQSSNGSASSGNAANMNANFSNMSLTTRGTPATSVYTSPNSTIEIKKAVQPPCVDGTDVDKVAHENNIIDKQQHCITELRARVKELEVQTDRDDKEYQDTLNRLKSSLLAISANRKFLGSRLEVRDDEEYQRRPKYFGHEEGKTYVLKL
ncbi:hypothetical protein FOA43_000407 [Brettanomyces nanus]|uniref:Uncharacterized protein n=1 Tax=Eeniella nana TaxID=13502 RepID=A0A875RYW1_EENNA|nr:uncharacterized protein FOA43_000407 [Brettanomyces nanus]QPG73102.1 hypothetical protein FOA43_000407 [Brettanomyces nanus]